MALVERIPNRLFAWGPDRRSLRWDSAPFDDDGADLTLWDGCERDPELPINLEVPRRGKVTDFLYSPLLLLFVSARAWNVIREFRIDSVRVHPLILRDRDGAVFDDSYAWLNCRTRAPLLKRRESGAEVSEHGTVRRIRHFVIDPDAVPADDVFMCTAPYLRVFKERVVRDIRAARLTGAVFEPLEGLSYPM
jgi:hypothetical protein